MSADSKRQSIDRSIARKKEKKKEKRRRKASKCSRAMIARGGKK